MRSVQLENIKLAISRSHTALEQNHREQNLLERMPLQPSSDTSSEQSLDARVEPRAQQAGPLLNDKGQVLILARLF